MSSFKVGVKGPTDTTWVYNSLRFATREEAARYGLDLMMRWTLVREYEVHESDEEPNR